MNMMIDPSYFWGPDVQTKPIGFAALLGRIMCAVCLRTRQAKV